MALAKIDEIFLYTDSGSQPIVTHELNAWFDHSGIPYSKLNYTDINNVKLVLDALNTWWQPDEDTGITQPQVTEFPLVVYTEFHTDKPEYYQPRKYIQGKQNIIEQMPDLYSLGR
jgi:hypothetical protein